MSLPAMSALVNSINPTMTDPTRFLQFNCPASWHETSPRPSLFRSNVPFCCLFSLNKSNHIHSYLTMLRFSNVISNHFVNVKTGANAMRLASILTARRLPNSFWKSAWIDSPTSRHSAATSVDFIEDTSTGGVSMNTEQHFVSTNCTAPIGFWAEPVAEYRKMNRLNTWYFLYIPFFTYSLNSCEILDCTRRFLYMFFLTRWIQLPSGTF